MRFVILLKGIRERMKRYAPRIRQDTLFVLLDPPKPAFRNCTRSRRAKVLQKKTIQKYCCGSFY